MRRRQSRAREHPIKRRGPATSVARVGPEFSRAISRCLCARQTPRSRKRQGRNCRSGQTLPPVGSTGPGRKALFFRPFYKHRDGTRLATSVCGNTVFGPDVSLNGIAASALSALKTNSAALGVVSNNVTNLNTPGYARRVVNESTLSANGQLMGVEIATVQRVADQFFSQEAYAAGGFSSQYDTEANLFAQRNGQLGGPGDNQSLSTGLTNLAAAFATASQAPSSAAGYTGVANALQSLAATISTTSGTITALQKQIDGQVSSTVTTANSLIKQVYDLNQQIKTASGSGDNASALLDQRDVTLTSLAQVIGIRISPQPDGSTLVATTDGVQLVG